MNKLKKFFNNTGNLIAGPAESFHFEHQLYNASSIIIAFFVVVANVVNAMIGLNELIIYLGWAGFFISLIFYYRSRFQRKFDDASIRLYILFTALICSVLYFYNSGLNGPMIYILVMFLMIFEIIAPLHLQLEVALLLGLNILGLLVLEYFHPSFVTDYNDRDQKFADNFATIFYTLFFTFLALRAFKSRFTKERQKVLDQNERLVEQQRLLEEQTEALQEAFQTTSERNKFIETLLHELSHRVKNNLQVIISLLSLQATQLTDEKAKAAIEDSKRRLISIQILHQKLYRDNMHADVDMERYLEELVETIVFMAAFNEAPNVTMDINKTILSVDQALPLGLIINELLSNSLKHAFNSYTGEKKVSISLATQENELCRLTFRDNGNWVPPEKEGKSFGFHLVSILSRQIGGQFNIRQDNGTEITLLFPYQKPGEKAISSMNG